MLTRAGERMLERLGAPARRAQARVLSAFTLAESAQFLTLLEKFITRFNATTRVPLEEWLARRRRSLSDRKSGLADLRTK